MEQHVQRYTKYIHEMVRTMDLDTATYKDHLHKVFEWYGCIQLSRDSGHIVLRWEDVPADVREEKGMSRDMGIDAWDREGDRVIQMKLYSGCIGWRSFSTFWAACHTSFKDNEKILYRNAESTLQSLIQMNIQKGELRDIKVTDAEFRSACRAIQKKRLTPLKEAVVEEVLLRPYQAEAMTMMEKARDEGRNLLVCLPTGTGKTVVTVQYHLAHRVPFGEKMLILVPTLVLMEQWSEACRKVGVEAYLIGTNQHRSLGEYAEQSVVICVYDSFGVIAGEVGRFGRIVVDEAHHVLVPERYMETEQEFEGSVMGSESEGEWDEEEEEEEEEEKKVERVISYMSQIRSLAQTQRVVYLSATIDKPEDGSLYYEYKVRQAIQDGYLCDYEFVFPIFERAYETNQHLAEYLVHRQQETHCLVYASNRAEGREFVDRLNALQPGCAGYIDGTTRPASRKKLFSDFELGKIRFLVNIRVLVEGFDAPHIRSIFFLRVSSSDIFIIQAIGRALRLHTDKVKASVYVPFTHEGDIDRIQAFLSQLTTYDERVGESIKGGRVGGYVRIERGEAEDVGDVEEEDGDGDEKEDEKEEVFAFRYNLVVDRMGSDSGGQLEAIALKRAEEYIAWVGEKERRPKLCLQSKRKKEGVTEEEKVEHWLASWMERTKLAKRGYIKCRWTLYSSVEHRLNQSLGEEWWKKINREEKQIQITKEYIQWVQEYGKHPSNRLRTEKDKENMTDENRKEKRLTQWMVDMKKKQRNGKQQKIYSSVLQLLIATFGEDWYENKDLEKHQIGRAEEYIRWVQENGKHPSRSFHSKVKSGKFTDIQVAENRLGQWMSDMKKAKEGRGSTTLYPAVEELLRIKLDQHWYEKEKPERDQLLKVNEYIKWVEMNDRHPIRCLETPTQKKEASNEQLKENQLAIWISNIKKAKRNGASQGRGKVFQGTEEKLNTAYGTGWWQKENLEENQLHRAHEYVRWVQQNGRHPKQCLQNHSKRHDASEEKLEERKLAIWMCNMKLAKHGKRSALMYPSLEGYLINSFGPDWHTMRKINNE